MPWLELSQQTCEEGRLGRVLSGRPGMSWLQPFLAEEAVSFLKDSQLSLLLRSQQRPGDASGGASRGPSWYKGSVAA